MNKITVTIFLFLLTINNYAQNKPDGVAIKTSFPENSIVSIKNDVHNPDEGTVEKKHLSKPNFIANKSSISKSNFDVDAFQTLIETGSEQYLSHCVVTERTGSTAGTIWVVAGIRSSNAAEDRIGVFKTGPNGWILQTTIFTQRYLGYSIDAELIETSSGGKYLWMVVESRQSLFSRREVYYAGLNTENPFERITGILNWPGAGPNDEYYNARITTDNFTFPDDSEIYVVASLDSLTFDNKHVNAQKLARIVFPHNPVNSEILYRRTILPVYWPDGGTTETHYLYSDIAYYRLSQGNDKLIFTYSNVPDDTRIWLSTCYYSGANAEFIGTIEGHGNYKIGNSAISAPNGGISQQFMVVFEENYQNSGDWDLVSARSNDAASTWYLNYIDGYSSTTDKIPHLGTIVGRMGVEDEYYVSYALDNPADSIMSAKSNNGVSNYWDQRVRMDGVYPPTYITSSVGITNTPDERVTVWSSLIGGNNFNLIGSFWPNLPSSVSDETETDLNSFQLSQNYPNPFNPSTIIQYTIPELSGVSLKVYDVLGKEVAVLVNEVEASGIYKIPFQADGLTSGVYFYTLSVHSEKRDFSETKKMVVIK